MALHFYVMKVFTNNSILFNDADIVQLKTKIIFEEVEIRSHLGASRIEP